VLHFVWGLYFLFGGGLNPPMPGYVPDSISRTWQNKHCDSYIYNINIIQPKHDICWLFLFVVFVFLFSAVFFFQYLLHRRLCQKKEIVRLVVMRKAASRQAGIFLHHPKGGGGKDPPVERRHLPPPLTKCNFFSF